MKVEIIRILPTLRFHKGLDYLDFTNLKIPWRLILLAFYQPRFHEGSDYWDCTNIKIHEG